MPLYEYRCTECGHADDEFQHMKEEHLTQCPACDAATYRRQVSVPHSDMVEFAKPIDLYSIGLNDDEEIAAFKRKAPDVHVETDPRSEMYGIPQAKNRKQKLAALAAMGYVEIK